MARPKINDFSVEGNLVEDPRHVVTGTDRNLVVFKLAENNRVRNPQTQEWEDAAPTYYEVGIDADNKRLGQLGSNVLSSLKQGHRVSVEGSYTAEPYVDKQGQPGVNHRVWAHDVSPSLKFASAEITPNQREVSRGASASAGASAQNEATVSAGSEPVSPVQREAMDAWSSQAQSGYAGMS